MTQQNGLEGLKYGMQDLLYLCVYFVPYTNLYIWKKGAC